MYMRNFLILISFLAGTSLLPAFVLAQTTTGDVNPNASAAICVNLRNNLSRGTSNAQTNGEVSILQMFLQSTSTPGSNTPYLAGDPTGFFGILTENAAKRFQADQQLLSSGYVGPLTRDKIKSLTCNGGSTSANFSASPAIGLSPLPVIFTFQVEPHTAVRPIQYRTDFGDEQHNSATVIPCPHSDSCTGGIGSVSHTYTTPGTYTANLIKTVYNDCRATENMACAAWVSREENMGSAAVTVTQSETARTYLNFTASPTSGSAPLNVAFSLSRYIEGNLQLDFGDDTIRNTDDSCLIGSDCKEQYVRSHIYTTAGTYRAKLIRQIACITTPCVGDTIGIVTINVTGNSSTIRAGGDTPSTTTECTELTRDLSLRSTDAATSGEVSLLQLFLQSTISSLGTPYLASEPTGFFGQLTRAAVLLFQKDNGLELAGVVGPITRAKIKELSCVGTSSSSPTATLNSNNSKNLTVNTGDPITHTWNSTGGTSWRSTYTISGCAQAKGPLTWWNGNSANGSEVGTVSAGYEGCTWTLNYTVTGLGGTATDRVNITINPITSTTTECTELTRDLSLRSTDAATGGEVSLLQLFLQTTAWPTSGTNWFLWSTYKRSSGSVPER
jgi:peptidoglycan hydrolase-like protein with peptidoglycan-binding domain